MVSTEDLKGVALFEDCTDQMLEHVVRIAKQESYGERQMVYEPGDVADRLFSVKRGKVLLEAELAPTFIISIGAIKQGYSFGWSALFPSASHYTSYAVCTEPSEILSLPRDEFLALLDSDHAMGYLCMHKATRILENRLERRTAQFLKVISKHPEIGLLLGLETG